MYILCNLGEWKYGKSADFLHFLYFLYIFIIFIIYLRFNIFIYFIDIPTISSLSYFLSIINSIIFIFSINLIYTDCWWLFLSIIIYRLKKFCLNSLLFSIFLSNNFFSNEPFVPLNNFIWWLFWILPFFEIFISDKKTLYHYINRYYLLLTLCIFIIYTDILSLFHNHCWLPLVFCVISAKIIVECILCKNTLCETVSRKVRNNAKRRIVAFAAIGTGICHPFARN